MKLINCLLLYIVLAVFSSGTAWSQTSQPVNAYFFHTIEKGQSLYSIASMYNVSQAEIIAMNPGCEEKIYAGQTLRIPQNKNSKGIQYHTIQPQETLYQLTVKYKVSAKEICDANPGLSAQNFRIGQVIIIPSGCPDSGSQTAPVNVTETIRPEVKPNCREMHKVERKETLFSITRQYGITEKELLAANPEIRDGLKKGSFLCIPYPQSQPEKNSPEVVTVPQNNTELFDSSRKQARRINPIKAAVILPFLSDGKNRGESNRMVEYYEGFLMAVDSLKRIGVSTDLYTYDSGNSAASIKTILAKNEMKDMDIIFGPLNQAQIKPLAEFTKKNKINLVIPFSSRDNEVFNNPYVFQVNTPQSYLYSEVYEHFTRKFGDSNIIILNTENTDPEKEDFINGLKEELSRNRIPFKTISASTGQATLKAAMNSNKGNIFVLTSGTNVALIKTLPQLTMLVRENPEYKISLFGYPEWQTYTKDHLANFYELDTYFYSSFYTNNLFPQAISFTNAYRKWYGKEMGHTYPKYGMLGFDTGYFFLYGLSRYGSEFANDINQVNITPIQTGFKFERANNWGGFINKKVFFVHFTKNFELVKLDFE